ncbi:CPBP family intramembrane glutamic endopeptidase [Pricia antarctica]|nr:type II CAAX endopeptidase family protein [Pricia antarctica]
MENILRPVWKKVFNFNWKFGLFLILVVCLPRFALVLDANATKNYGYIGLVMVVSALAPFIFLTRKGLKEIGITKPKNYRWLLIGFFIGLIISLLLFYLGDYIYGDTFNNWYNYIGRSYNIPPDIGKEDKVAMFLIMAVTGMVFSPIGEELFFRGIVHSSFAKSIGDRKASLVDSLAFALTHISHFGLVFVGGGWNFLLLPTIIWVLGMFMASIFFFASKFYSGSILGAILCHSGFNLGMIYCIFYML